MRERPLITRSVTVVAPPVHGLHRFLSWVARDCRAGTRALDIGAGSNLSGGLDPIKRRSVHLVGLDPDASILSNASLDERYLQSLEEFADASGRLFDVAFAVYVLEHVSEPAAFTQACARVLRPGGSFFGLTLNLHQYFGLVTWAATRTGTSEWLLEKLKGDEVVAAYHFPTQYRLNTVNTLTSRLDDAGFESVEFRCFDDTVRYAWYLPNRLKWFAAGYTRAAYAVGTPALMGHISFRAVRGPSRS